MADKLYVDTEWLDQCAQKLSAIQAALDGAAGLLYRVETGENAGGGARVHLNARIGGRICSASTVAEAVTALCTATQELSDDVAMLSNRVVRTSEAFADVSARINRSFDCLGGGTDPETRRNRL